MQASFLRLIRDLPAATTLVLASSDRARRAWRSLLLAQADPGRPQALPRFLTMEEWFAQLWQDARLLGRLPQALDLAEPLTEAGLWPGLAREQASMSVAEAQPIASQLAEAYRLAWAYAESSRADVAYSVEMQPIARAFERRLEGAGLMSRACLAQAIAEQPGAFIGLLPRCIIRLPGFFTWPDQELALRRLQEQHGLQVLDVGFEASAAPAQRWQAREREDERQAALDWAVRLAERGAISCEHPAIIVEPELAREHGLWRRLLVERGIEANLSLGPALSSYPWAAVGFSLVAACFQPLAVEVLQQALIHPRWGWPLEARQRWARLAPSLLEDGVRELDLPAWFQRAGDARLAERILAARGDFGRAGVRRTRRQWADCYAALIAALSEQAPALDSTNWQLREALLEAVEHWCALDRLLPPLTQSEAQAEWRAMTDRMPYQPQQSVAAGRIQILGLLESAGLPHGGLWCLGASDRVLPEATRLNPFLNPAWQRRLAVGLSDAAHARQRAERLRALWLSLGPEVQASCPQEEEGEPIAWSPLFTNWPCADLPQASSTPADALAIATIEDEVAPEPKTGTLDTRSLEAQALCPRLGFAVSRLQLEPWPRARAGIAPLLRGQIVHAVAERYGQAIRGQCSDTLDWSALRAALPEWIEAALTEQAGALQAVPKHILAVEKVRLGQLFERFLETESRRSSFTLLATEQAMQTELSGAVFRLKVDRIDRLSSASEASSKLIIDYKSGQAELRGLLDERLTAPQLPLYAQALGWAEVAGVAYQRLDDDDARLLGLGEGPTASKRSQELDFEALKARWQTALAALVQEWQRGEAALAPADGASTCAHCMAAGFCRVDALAAPICPSASEDETAGEGS